MNLIKTNTIEIKKSKFIAYNYTITNQDEVKEILQYYKVPEAFEQTKKWYDGYRFGSADIYCPWEVLNHCKALKVEPDATPQPYWINTSGNYIVKRFIEKANQQRRLYLALTPEQT